MLVNDSDGESNCGGNNGCWVCITCGKGGDYVPLKDSADADYHEGDLSHQVGWYCFDHNDLGV